MSRFLFAGTFDPPTLGHLDLIQRASSLCDELIVGLSDHALKPTLTFSLNEREAMLNEITRDITHVKVIPFRGLLVDFAKKQEATCLIRGLRRGSPHEMEMASANRELGNLDTLFLLANPKLIHISSSLIREIASFGHRLHAFVPEKLEEIIFERLNRQKES